MKPLDQQTALVTGGARGIGRGIAEALADAGVRVAITARSYEAAAEAATAIGRGARGYALDVRRHEQVTEVFAAVERELGGLDVLVNNAGVGHFAPVAEMSLEDWHETIETNLNGVFYCTRAAVPLMRRAGGGYVFNIGSLAGHNAFANGGAYCASKHAVNGFSEVLFQELREDGIRVTQFMPGSVATEFGRGMMAKRDWALQPADLGEMVVDLLRTHPRALHSRIEMRPSRPRKG